MRTNSLPVKALLITLGAVAIAAAAVFISFAFHAEGDVLHLPPVALASSIIL